MRLSHSPCHGCLGALTRPLPTATEPAMSVSDRLFLAVFLPLAVAVFCGSQLAVLHAFGLVLPTLQRIVTAPHAMQSYIELWASGVAFPYAVTRPDDPFLPIEVPLLFQTETYPRSGRKLIQLEDARFLTLVRHNETSAVDAQPVYVGYVPISETQKHNDPSYYPEGDLIQVKGVSLDESHVAIETETKQQRFRLKKVRRDAASGVLYGRVEWI